MFIYILMQRSSMRRLMPNRKGDLTINTIIVAAIGLLVLVVLIATFTGQLKGWSDALGGQRSAQSLCSSACTSLGSPQGNLVDGACQAGQTLAGGEFKVGDQAKFCCCTNK